MPSPFFLSPVSLERAGKMDGGKLIGSASGPQRLRRAHGQRHCLRRVSTHYSEESFCSERPLKFCKEGRGTHGTRTRLVLHPHLSVRPRKEINSCVGLLLPWSSILCVAPSRTLSISSMLEIAPPLRVSLTMPLHPFLTRPQRILFVDYSIRHCRPATRRTSSSPPSSSS